MKWYALLLFLLILPSVSASSAAAIAGASAANSYPAVGQHAGGCTPPINFSIENKCTLSFWDRTSVNTFWCQVDIDEGNSYKVVGDCNGGVLEVSDMSVNMSINWDGVRFYTAVILVGIIVFILFSLIAKCVRGRK